MRILYVCADPGIPIHGRKGCSTHVRETCMVLQELGHEVRLLCSNVEGDDPEAGGFRIDSVEPLRSRKWGFDVRHILLDRRLGRRLDALIEEWKPDAIYERYSLYSFSGMRAARRHRLPRLLEVNAFLTREQSDRIRMPRLARMAEKKIVRGAPRVIVVSEPLRQEIAALGIPVTSIARMPMAVNLGRFHPGVDGAQARRRLGLEGRFVIGYVGTLSGWHGLKLLRDVARRLSAAGAPPFAFVIVGGEGRKLEENREEVAREGLADQVRYVGSVPHEAVPEMIRAMDAAVVPDTTYWSSPAKLFEYMACGVPVLAPDYPAIRDAMEDGREGHIFPAGDTAAMAERILRMMNAGALRAAMGQAARERAEREHSWHTNGMQILGLYDEILREAGAGR